VRLEKEGVRLKRKDRGLPRSRNWHLDAASKILNCLTDYALKLNSIAMNVKYWDTEGWLVA